MNAETCIDSLVVKDNLIVKNDFPIPLYCTYNFLRKSRRDFFKPRDQFQVCCQWRIALGMHFGKKLIQITFSKNENVEIIMKSYLPKCACIKHATVSSIYSFHGQHENHWL